MAKLSPKDLAWQKIFNDLKIHKHDFNKAGFVLWHKDIKESCAGLNSVSVREVRTLGYQDTRESMPQIFKDNGLFMLAISNKAYIIIKGEGYIDVPHLPDSQLSNYIPQLDFPLYTSLEGDSEMQYLDNAFANSVIKTFMEDDSLCLTIRGRKRVTRKFSFRVGQNLINVGGVQTEVDGGYEGRDKIVLVEAKPASNPNVLIRQIYYPFRKWQDFLIEKNVDKKIYNLLFQKDAVNKTCSIWQFEFTDPEDYNSIKLIRSKKFKFLINWAEV